ncbi:Uma2 family endonuclease [Leptolyngbya sp. FACHB-321]|uniref:Uma2 family endonuclease n=1 Tax=Leptolyngbya sp. FACHB-321 TaxID=2692807 RepID=UPI0016842CC8|nr:Uma2 family endonuclease [Leptolyngbya sp. FACHB-321]MBD2037857.1 Uma2 family endonuclease [Leptolyngbya sp. FACHB-321]
MVLQANHLLTLQAFLALPPGEGDITYELIDGQAVPKMFLKKFHSSLTRAFLFLLCPEFEGRGEVYPELGIALTWQGRDWVLTPDLVYISYERLPASWQENTVCPVPPDLAIEIISPGQTFGQLAAKARAYLDANVLRVWVVDSKARSITVFYPDAPPQTYMGNTLLTDKLFEGLAFTAEQVFQKAGIPLG